MFSFRCHGLDIAHKSGFSECADEDYSRHIHYYHELLYFVRGSVIYNIGAVKKKLESGDLLVICEGQSHFPEVVDDGENYERYVVKFSDNAIPEYLKAKLRMVRPYYGKLAGGMRIFKKFDIYAETYSQEDMYTLCMCDIVKMLVDICRSAATENAGRPGLAERIMEYIDNNLNRSITSESIARQFNFSVSYVSDEFKKSVGIPIMQYVRYKKIITAHRLISAGMKKLDVAEALGFENYTTFYRAYHRLMGVAPSMVDSNK